MNLNLMVLIKIQLKLTKVIFDEYTKSVEEFEEAKNVNQFHLDNIRRCKSLRTDINKAKTWKGKAILAFELIEILTSETGFAKSNML